MEIHPHQELNFRRAELQRGELSSEATPEAEAEAEAAGPAGAAAELHVGGLGRVNRPRLEYR